MYFQLVGRISIGGSLFPFLWCEELPMWLSRIRDLSWAENLFLGWLSVGAFGTAGAEVLLQTGVIVPATPVALIVGHFLAGISATLIVPAFLILWQAWPRHPD